MVKETFYVSRFYNDLHYFPDFHNFHDFLPCLDLSKKIKHQNSKSLFQQ